MSSIVIERLAPGAGKVGVDWSAITSLPPVAPLYLEIKERGAAWEAARQCRLAPESRSAVIAGLKDGLDYELRLRVITPGSDTVMAESATRLVRPGPVPGVVVNYIHPEDYTYNSSGRSPASPSIAILPDGRYVAAHDVFWTGHGQNLSMVFHSADQGKSWRFASDIQPCFWGELFVHRGSLYMLSTATSCGALLIRRSGDGGYTWSNPAEILPGGDPKTGGPTKAPVPVVEHHGRLWSAVENGSWQLGFDAGVVSVPADADLMDPGNWTVTPFLKYDSNWPGTISGGDRPRMLEGNVVVTPEGTLVNILRYHTTPDYGKAIMLDIDMENPAVPLRFCQVIDFPGNMSKFTIRHDQVARSYFSLVNRTSANVGQRNILTLIRSRNLYDWEIVRDILNYEENGWPEDYTKVGFQYVDWLVEGEDIIALSRTAINGAWNFHNANHITFHRIGRFRACGDAS